MEQELNYSVYKHTAPNGKIYVGLTSQQPTDRWKNGHGYRKNVYFHRAIEKYGWENIESEIIHKTTSSKVAEDLEVYMIEKLNANNPSFGYNLTTGGEKGKRHSEATKLLISKKLKGVNSGKSHRCYGMTAEEIFGEEAFKKNVERTRKRWSGSQNPQKLNPIKGEDHYLYGKKMPKEWREKAMKTRQKNGSVILNTESAKEIRERYINEPITLTELGLIYGVSHQTLSDVIRNIAWVDKDYSVDLEELSIIKEKQRIEKIKSAGNKPVASIDTNGKIINRYESLKEASKYENMSDSGIAKHAKNQVRKPRFIWL